MTASLKASPLLAQAPSTRVAGRGASPSQSAMMCPMCPCPSNRSPTKLPMYSASMSVGSMPLSTVSIASR